jgi:hypothetical protein
MNCILGTCALTALMIATRTTFAVEPAADAQQPANRVQAGAAMTETDARLKSRLRGNPSAGGERPPDELLERAAGLMRSAGERLQNGQTGQKTRADQQEAVAALDELIRQLEQPPPPSDGGSPPPPDPQKTPPPNSQDSQQNQKPPSPQSPQPDQPDQSQRPDQRTQQNQPGEREQPEDSEERERERQRREAAELKRKKLQTDVWGHLPEHLREQLLNTYSERMLPKYENLVRQFYERLSETPAKKSPH